MGDMFMVKIFDRDNKYKTILVILLILFFLIVTGSVIASNVEFKEKDEGIVATVLNDGDLVISYNDGNLINISDNKVHKYTVSITNNSYEKLYYSVFYGLRCSLLCRDVVMVRAGGNLYRFKI